MRRLDNETCEMKRMYVDDRARGRGLGWILSEAIINEARHAGYKNMRLDTLERLMPALNLYRSLGFSEIEQYCANPFPDAVFMELSLVDYRAPTSRSISGFT